VTDELLIMYGILLQRLFLCQLWCELLFERIFYQTNILQQFFEWLSLTWEFAQLLLEHCDFLNIDISQSDIFKVSWNI